MTLDQRGACPKMTFANLKLLESRTILVGWYRQQYVLLLLLLLLVDIYHKRTKPRNGQGEGMDSGA
jgi:hypothetical protein